MDADGIKTVRFAPVFPSPRRERVPPGHLVAVASAPQADDAVVWGWSDEVVLGHEGNGSVRLWEPDHGEVVARARPSYEEQPSRSRGYAAQVFPDIITTSLPDAPLMSGGKPLKDTLEPTGVST